MSAHCLKRSGERSRVSRLWPSDVFGTLRGASISSEFKRTVIPLSVPSSGGCWASRPMRSQAIKALKSASRRP